MGGGNGQKSAKAREKAQAKAAKGGAGSMLSTFFSFVFFSFSLISLFVERYPLNYIPNWKQTTSGAHFSFSLFFLEYNRNRGKRSGEIDPVQSVHASVRVDAESLGVEKARGE